MFSEQPKIVRNRFARAIFGVTSLPHLLNETVRKHAQKYDFDIDFISTVFNSIYVDDLPAEKIVLKVLFYYSKS